MNELRREARIIALKVLYEQEFHYQDTKEDGIKRNIQKPFLKDPEVQRYSHRLLNGIKVSKVDIDTLIKQTSKFWSLDRMSLIDLNIMRMAVYEMIYASPLIPFKVCISEAMEIAKIYGTADSYSFINGILDTISQNIHKHPTVIQKRKVSLNEEQESKNS